MPVVASAKWRTAPELVTCLRQSLNLAYLDGANFDSAHLEDAVLTDIYYTDRTRWPPGFTPPPSRATA